MREPEEHHLEVVRTARFWMAGGATARPGEVWFVLHGYGQLARRFLRRFAPLDDGTRWIVAPEALNRFYTSAEPGRHGPGSVVGATWMTREDRLHEIDDYVAYLDRLADTVLARVREGDAAKAGGEGDGHGGTVEGDAGPRVVVLGFSQGVATASRWTVLGRVRPERLVLWGDFLPPDLPLEAAGARLRGVDVVLARGARDPVFADPGRAREEAERLASAGVIPRTVTYPGGHEVDAGALQSVAAERDT